MPLPWRFAAAVAAISDELSQHLHEIFADCLSRLTCDLCLFCPRSYLISEISKVQHRHPLTLLPLNLLRIPEGTAPRSFSLEDVSWSPEHAQLQRKIDAPQNWDDVRHRAARAERRQGRQSARSGSVRTTHCGIGTTVDTAPPERNYGRVAGARRASAEDRRPVGPRRRSAPWQCLAPPEEDRRATGPV